MQRRFQSPRRSPKNQQHGCTAELLVVGNRACQVTRRALCRRKARIDYGLSAFGPPRVGVDASGKGIPVWAQSSTSFAVVWANRFDNRSHLQLFNFDELGVRGERDERAIVR